MGEVVPMSRREIDRHHVIQSALEGRLNQNQASAMLRLSVRQVKRLCKKVRLYGPAGLVHKLRGRVSNHQLDPEVLERAACALQDPLWEGFKPTFAQQKLEELHGIKLSDERVRQLMGQLELWQARRAREKHRQWRERRPSLGMLVQLDGSTHDWFEGRGPKCVLLIYIDDATSRILYGEFVDVEDTWTLLQSTKGYLKRWGRPGAFYVDKDSIYTTNKKATVEEQFREEQPMTQFTRAMSQLGVDVITADSPQAKGRVERGFHTHQDRLVKELRLAGISTLEEANAFLKSYIDDHNARFAVIAARPGDMHRPLLSDAAELADILSIQTPRKVQRDFTVKYNNRYFQLGKNQGFRLRPRAEVTVQLRLDGSLRLLFRGKRLDYRALPQRPQRVAAAAKKAKRRPRPKVPDEIRVQRRFGSRGSLPMNQPASYYMQE